MNGVTVNTGYAFVFRPPEISSGTLGTVNMGMLVTQWLGVLIIGGIALFMLKDR